MLHKDYDLKGSVEKKTLVVNLKGLDAKMNSKSNSDSNFDFESVSVRV
jgi:hypothetical protein